MKDSNKNLRRLLEATNKENWDKNDPLSTIRLGTGFRSFDGSAMAQAVEVPDEKSDSMGGGSFSSCTVIESIYSLRKTLNVGVEAGFSLGVFSASANITFLEQIEYNSYDLYVLAYMNIWLPPTIIDGTYNLIEQAKEDARSMSQLEFYSKYGDSFVSAIHKGGNLYGMLQISCQSQSQKNALSIEISAGLGGILSASSKFKSAVEIASKITKTQTLFLKVGGKPAFVTVENFYEQLDGFGKEVLEVGGEPISINYDSYDLVNWEDDFQPKPDYTNPKRYFIQASRLAEKCSEIIEDCNRVINSPDLFDLGSVSLDEVAEGQKIAQDTFDSSLAYIESIAENPFVVEEMDTVDLTKIKLPIFKPIVPPIVWTWVGSFGVGIINGDSNSFAGIQGRFNDSFGIGKQGGQPYDIHFYYRGKFKYGSNLIAFAQNPEDREYGSGNLGKCGPPDGYARLEGISVAIGGSDAYLFEVCYQFRFLDGSTSGIVTSGNWLNGVPSQIRVFLRLRG